MTTWRRAAVGIFAAALACVGAPRLAHAQTIRLSVSGIVGDSMSPAPVITVNAFESAPQSGPYTVSLELSLESQFRAPFYARLSGSLNPSFTVDSLLPAATTVFMRTRLIDRFGTTVAEARDQHVVRSWLRLVAPTPAVLSIVPTRTPTFVWSSPAITVPPGLWTYDLSVINNATGRADFTVPNLQDTSYAFPTPLQSSTSYRWQVRARAENGVAADEITLTSAGTFVIASPDQPTVTLFYQNFPNPFGRGIRTDATCFWFDLAHPSTVTLTIYDIALHEVRHLVPGDIGTGVNLPVGAYGRQNVSAQTGCDDRLSWDGRDDTGRTVPSGVYVAVFKGDHVRQSVKILYRGP